MKDVVDIVIQVVAFIIVSFILAVPIYFLWNFDAVPVFDLPKVTFMQTWGLKMLLELMWPLTGSGNSVRKVL